MASESQRVGEPPRRSPGTPAFSSGASGFAWTASIVDTIAGWVRAGVERVARHARGASANALPHGPSAEDRRGKSLEQIPAPVPVSASPRARVRSGLRGSRARRGFTILELMAALACITGVAAFSIWAYFSRAEITLENAARLLVQDVQLAQTRAAYSQAPVEIVFLPKGDGYFVRNADPDGVLPSERTPRRYSVDAIFEGVEIVTKRVKPGDTVLVAPDGRLRTQAVVTLGFDGHARTIIVDAKANVAFLADGLR